MANSKFEYVKKFEQSDSCLLNTYIVVRVDGKGFHKFSETHDFIKPNDRRALDLMNHSAKAVMEEFLEIGIAYGCRYCSFTFLLKSVCYLDICY